MATAEQPSSHREEIGLVVRSAGTQFTAVATAITLGAPLVAYLSGVATGSVAPLFYVHVSLGAFWFGLDFFFKFVLGPALEQTDPEAANAVNGTLTPRLVAVAEPLSVGVVGSGIALAHLLGLWATPSVWLWAALGIGVLMLLNGFGPLHVYTTEMVVEMNSADPDGERLDELFGKVQVWGLLQTVFMPGIVVAMVGLRGLI